MLLPQRQGRWNGIQSCSCGVNAQQEERARLRLAAETREAAKPGKQRGEMRPVLLRHGREFQSQSFTRLAMPHDHLGPDLAFLDEKIELGFRANRPWTWGSNKQTSGAQIPYAGNFIPTITAPIDPDTVRRLDARGMSPRVGRRLGIGRHKAL